MLKIAKRYLKRNIAKNKPKKLKKQRVKDGLLKWDGRLLLTNDRTEV